MLCINEISKTYKPKKGVPVRALDNVSLSFADKGLVFILGKSGSGKSTLLNIMGGLDNADSGEFIINGKSSKDFKAADFNAYRNTCVGFIFQEYNLLDEFSVGENIALALEFQGRAADGETLNKILEDVGLEGYAKRKTNELSGGQRQRVAIARALIKNPEIIMADEPTGALDSETGKQVLETLKSLSCDKLVLVVSHDREFAEQFGDRIIELSDGKVVYDSQVGEAARSQDDSDRDSISDGKEPCEHKFIRSRLPYKRALRMGAVSIKTKPLRLIVTMILCFFSFTLMGVIDTGMSYDAKKVAVEGLVKSGYDSIATIGGQWTEDYRYSSTVDYYKGLTQDELDRLRESTGLDFMGVAVISGERFGYSEMLEFADASLLRGENMSSYYTESITGFLPAESSLIDSIGELVAGRLPQSNKEIVITKYLYDQFALAGYRYQDDSSGEIIYLEPAQIKSEQEFLDINPLIKYIQYKNTREFRRDTWTIVGILDTGADKNGMFDNLKPSDDNWMNDSLYNYEIHENCNDYFRYGFHSLGYIWSPQYEELINYMSVYPEGLGHWAKAARGDIHLDKNITVGIVGAAKDKDLDKMKNILWLDGKSRDKLEENEIVIGMNSANNIIVSSDISESYKYYKHNKSFFDGMISFERCSIIELDRVGAEIAICQYAEKVDFDKLQPFINYIKEDKRRISVSFRYSSDRIRPDKWDVDNMSETEWRIAYAGYLNMGDGEYGGERIKGGYYQNITGLPTGEQIALTDGYMIYIQAKLDNFSYKTEFEDAFVDFYQASSKQNYSYRANKSPMNVVGIYVPNYDEILNFERHKDPYVFSNTIYDIAPNKEFKYAFAVAKMPSEFKDIAKLVDYHYETEGRQARLINGIVKITGNITSTVTAWINMTLKYCMIAFVIISMLQLSNYIAASISGRKKDIGILRALGANSGDICAIFCTESIIVALINCALAVIITPLICIGVNSMLPTLFNINAKLFIFGIRQVAVIFALGIATALAASIIPLFLICRKQPIQSIQGK